MTKCFFSLMLCLCLISSMTGMALVDGQASFTLSASNIENENYIMPDNSSLEFYEGEKQRDNIETVIEVPDSANVNPCISSYEWKENERNITYRNIEKNPEWEGSVEQLASGSAGSNLTWNLYNNGVLVILGSGPMDNWDFTNPWVNYTDKISAVIIEDGVTTIGDFAFNTCAEITALYIPDSITYIGKYAFSGCNKLEDIPIPDSVSFIGKRAFSSCASLKTARIPSSISSIEEGTFFSCNALTEVFIPDNVTVIGKMAFSNCVGLTKVRIPSSVVSIEEQAFHACKLLSVVQMMHTANNELQIEKYAFHDTFSYLNLTVQVPNPHAVHRNLFRHDWADDKRSVTYKALDEDTVTPPSQPLPVAGKLDNNLYWTIDYSGFLRVFGKGDMQGYLYDDTPAPWAANRDNIRTVIISDGVTSIGNTAFFCCKNLRTVRLPQSIISIGYGAFSDCTSLEAIMLPASITEISANAFESCSALKNILFSHSFDADLKIGNSAF